MKATKEGIDKQPVSQVEWLFADTLRANSWNPNVQATPEYQLLKTSMLACGWTQPIVITADLEIVDGFHRWSQMKDPEVAKMTGGKVPVVVIAGEKNQLMANTVRHNRARGNHHVLRMADIVRAMIESGLTIKAVQEAMGMEFEEVQRLADRGGMVAHGGDGKFSEAWVPE